MNGCCLLCFAYSHFYFQSLNEKPWFLFFSWLSNSFYLHLFVYFCKDVYFRTSMEKRIPELADRYSAKVLQRGISCSTQKDPVADRQCVRSSYSTMTQWKGFPFQHSLLRVGISLFSSISFRWLAKQKDLQFSVLSKKLKARKMVLSFAIHCFRMGK